MDLAGSVAVVGGGVAGCIFADALATALPAPGAVVVFDCGARGLGGRCGHREDVKLGDETITVCCFLMLLVVWCCLFLLGVYKMICLLCFGQSVLK